MPSSTPVKIRGKQKATKKEKWHYGKQRAPHRLRPRSESERIPSQSFAQRATTDQQRQKLNPEVSRLEQLPTEVLQTIFQYAANVNLPLVSRTLATQLASRHLYNQLTSKVLHPILDGNNSTTSAVTRLMNSRFFTWSFFKAWIWAEYDGRGMSGDLKEVIDSDAASAGTDSREWWIWHTLQPSNHLLPPKKLLRGPYTSEKIRFLNFLMSSFRGNPDEINPLYNEVVQAGLEQAVSEGADDALQSFWKLGMQPDTELVRQAVIDAGCQKEVVCRLVTRVLHSSPQPGNVDFLDPALWSWADKATRNSDEKGRWLINLLKQAAEASNRRGKGTQSAQ